MPDYYVYTLCHITSFLASKGLVIVPINLAKGSIVRLIVELHNIAIKIGSYITTLLFSKYDL